MRRITLLAVMTVLLLAVGAGTAYAALVLGTPQDDNLDGTPIRDTMKGYGGADVLRGFAGTDDIAGGAGPDIIFGGDGADSLRGRGGDDRLHGGAEDQSNPKIDDAFFCGKGYDIVFLEKGEHATHNLTVEACEEIRQEN